MIDTLVPFSYGDLPLRAINRDGEAWLVGRDICAILDIADARSSLNLLDPDERDSVPVTDALGRQQDTIIISEAGFYSLVLRSRKPEAIPFRRWVTHEVLPAIRKTGGYSQPPVDVAAISRRDLAQWLIESEDRAAAAEAQVAELAPKADLADTYLIADGGTRLIREAAKLLGMRERDLRTFLIDERFIFAKHAPCGDVQYDLYAEHAHHLVAKETVVNHTWGSCAHYTVRITPRGMDLIRKRLAAKRPVTTP